MSRTCKKIATPADLPPYHRRVCELLIQGLTNSEIAVTVGSNANAIKSMVGRMVQSIGLRNALTLAVWYAVNESYFFSHGSYPVAKDTHPTQNPYHQLTN